MAAAIRAASLGRRLASASHAQWPTAAAAEAFFGASGSRTSTAAAISVATNSIPSTTTGLRGWAAGWQRRWCSGVTVLGEGCSSTALQGIGVGEGGTVASFSFKHFDKEYLVPGLDGIPGSCNKYIDARLSLETAELANGYKVACLFVNDDCNAQVIDVLRQCGVGLIAMRCAGFNNVDLAAAEMAGIKVAHVPKYSPYAIAEHAVGLLLSVNRKIHRAYCRTRDGNFELSGLEGFDVHGRTVGVIGTGAIGSIFAKICQAFGCKILLHDAFEKPELIEMGMEYVSLPQIWEESDIISLHCPLLPTTYYMVSRREIAQMKKGVLIINTSRGALIDTAALIQGLESRKIGGVGLDVYENESKIFFANLADEIIPDDLFVRLRSFPQVLITAHQAFLTRDALNIIASVTQENVVNYLAGKELNHLVQAPPPKTP